MPCVHNPYPLYAKSELLVSQFSFHSVESHYVSFPFKDGPDCSSYLNYLYFIKALISSLKIKIKNTILSKVQLLS